MIVRCSNCNEICGDLKSRATIEQYLAGNFGIPCEHCGEDSYYDEEVRKKEEIQKGIEQEIKKKINFNEIIEKIYIQYSNIPTEKLQKSVYDFLEKLNTLDDMYKKADKHIPRID